MNKRADAYMGLGDGGGPIIIEVGKMAASKWQNYDALDGKPVRVLRVEYGGQCYMINPRNTEHESVFMDLLTCELATGSIGSVFRA